MDVAIVIPARLASTRLPEKMLLAKTGWPLIRHTYEQAKKAKLAQRVLIATDDEKIAAAIAQFGGNYVMTSPHHPTGTDRLAEVAERYLNDFDFIVNIQGDEPELNSQHIDDIIRLYQSSDAQMATLVTRFHAKNTSGSGSPMDPNCVKAVLGKAVIDNNKTTLGFEALYFSRSVVPFPRDTNGLISNASDYFLHLGVYAYSPQFLKEYVSLPQGPLELTEKLEQLRVLENGYKIVANIVSNATPGIDTQKDYDHFVERWKQKALNHEVCIGS